MPDPSPSRRSTHVPTLDLASPRLQGWRRLEFEGTPIYVRPEEPDWLVPTPRADAILRDLIAGRGRGEAAARYGSAWGASEDLAWEDVHRTIERLPARAPRPRSPRAELRGLEGLRECWLHVSNRCNLACTHCMFASSPDDQVGLSTARLLQIVKEARELGCRLFYLTGGEPLVHPGFVPLCQAILEDADAHVVILTNTLAVPRQEEALRRMPRDRVHFQVSLDCPGRHHDAIRGEGCYDRVLARTRRLVQLGFPVAFAMAVDGRNAHHMPDLVEVAASLGVA
ncbi:MAG TPA: radical SAM protein, partial [Vicinamibacterales bacterium]|nr:radical SAM protein [Vicinamibacterales bacterium]